MAMSTPFLSICIPTFNRSPYLCKTLDAIVSEPSFQETDEIEIVVSDNASTDDTPSLMSRFCSAYPGKIQYLHLTEPIDSHFNFQNALDHGRGEYLKLLNDTVMFRPGMLKQLCDEIRKHPDGDVFLTNLKNCHLEYEKRIRSVNEAVEYGSFFITWISSYTYRREKYCALSAPFRYFALSFPQEDIYFRILDDHGVSYFLNQVYFERQSITFDLSSRNEAKIFGDSYILFLQIYLKSMLLTESVFEREKRDVLFWHILPVYFDFTKEFFAGKNLGWKVFWKSMPQYHQNWYYYVAIVIAFVYLTAMKIPGIKQLMRWLKDFVKSFTRNQLVED